MNQIAAPLRPHELPGGHPSDPHERDSWVNQLARYPRLSVGEQIARYARPGGCWMCSRIAVVSASGCAGYQLGIGTLHRPEIRTVHVPVFESDSFRRFLGERLTEAVIKEIELQTTYKVVGSPDADSVLVGRIVDERKRVIGETKNDDARIIGTDVIVTINWYDRRGEALMPESCFTVAPLTFFTASSGDFVPEAGQSLATAHQESIERIARQIVQQIEVRW